MADGRTAKELVELYNAGEFPLQLARHFELPPDASIDGVLQCCARLHNSGEIDLLALVETGAIQALDGSDFFMASHFLGGALKHVDASVARMMSCINSLVEHGGSDGAANQPNGVLASWCEQKPERAEEIIANALFDDALAKKFLSFALQSGPRLQQAREIAIKYADERRLSAITALGRSQHVDIADRDETLQAFASILGQDADDATKACILYATASIVARSGEAPADIAQKIVQIIASDAGDQTLYQAAQILSIFAAALSDDMIVDLLSALKGVNPTHSGTVNFLDLALKVLSGVGRGFEASEFVTALLTDPGNELTLENFPNFAEALVRGPIDRLSSLVAKWLRRGDYRLCDGLSNAVQRYERGTTPLALSADDLVGPPAEVLFICRKAVGFLLLQPIVAASILVSALRVCADDVEGDVQDILVECLILNYGSVRPYLESLPVDDLAHTRVATALEREKAYRDGLASVPNIAELRPSERNRHVMLQQMRDQSRAISKSAEKQSVLLNLVRRSTLLYANRSITFVTPFNGRPHPMTMELKSHAVSFELPRMEIVDPVGLDRTLRILRRERMSS